MSNISSFRYDVQGLRAIAVLAVMIFHADKHLLPAGFLGVDLFFVISGFIITRQIINPDRQFVWTSFYWGRIKRIAPAYLVLLVITFALAAVLFIPQDFNWFRQSLKSALLFNSNNYFAGFGDYFAPSSHELPLLHTWSLAIEMQFYFILPPVLFLLPKKLRIPFFIIVGLLLLVWSEKRLGNDAQVAYFSLLSRIPEFLWGVVLACLGGSKVIKAKYRNSISILGLMIVFLSFWNISEKHYPGLWTIFPCVGAFMIIWANNGFANRLLSNRFLVWIGAISYSLYLWHWPILAFIRYVSGVYELSLFGWGVYVLFSFLLGWLSYKIIESPLRLSLYKNVLLVLLAIFLMANAVIVIYGKKLNRSIVEPLPVELTRYADPNTICHGKILESCLRGDASKERVLVIGDSHAGQLNLFFDEISRESDFAFEVITGSSCVPIEGFDVDKLSGWAQKPCNDRIDLIKSKVAEDRYLIIAGSWMYQTETKAFRDAFAAFLKENHLKYQKIIVLAQLPSFKVNMARAYHFSELGIPVRVEEEGRAGKANNVIEKIVSRYENVVFLDLSGNSLFDTAPILNGKLGYHDSHHLNEYGAVEYSKIALPALIKELEAD